MKKLVSLLLLLTMAVPAAFAVTEGKVEDAPDVDVSLSFSEPSSGRKVAWRSHDGRSMRADRV